MKKTRDLYPGVTEARREAKRRAREFRRERMNTPDLLDTAGGIAPNYEKFKVWDPAAVLAWCNID